MAQRRMFSPDIVESPEFLAMPASAQLLYFHLGMSADDDGFVYPQQVLRNIGMTADDNLKLLLAKRFILPFESGVVVIKHWLIHNMIRADRYKPTRYQDEKSTLFIKENNAYTDVATNGLQIGNQMAPQVRLGKDNKYTAKADSFEEPITEEPENPKKIRVPKDKQMQELCDWAEKRRGFPFVTVGKQFAALSKARTAGISPTRLKYRWMQQEGEAWREGKIDWMTVFSSFDKQE